MPKFLAQEGALKELREPPEEEAGSQASHAWAMAKALVLAQGSLMPSLLGPVVPWQTHSGRMHEPGTIHTGHWVHTHTREEQREKAVYQDFLRFQVHWDPSNSTCFWL
jgi:hypothetical protein